MGTGASKTRSRSPFCEKPPSAEMASPTSFQGARHGLQFLLDRPEEIDGHLFAGVHGKLARAANLAAVIHPASPNAVQVILARGDRRRIEKALRSCQRGLLVLEPDLGIGRHANADVDRIVLGRSAAIVRSQGRTAQRCRIGGRHIPIIRAVAAPVRPIPNVVIPVIGTGVAGIRAVGAVVARVIAVAAPVARITETVAEEGIIAVEMTAVAAVPIKSASMPTAASMSAGVAYATSMPAGVAATAT